MRLIGRITTVEEVLSEGARGVFMLMYELISPESTITQDEERQTSLSPTLDTLETTPSPLESNLQNVEPSPTSPTISDVPATEPIDLDLKLEKVHISPPSSDTSTDDNTDQDRKTSRSTSFSSVHSRPATQLFELKDPQLSPPPAKRVRIEESAS